ncbi:MAG: protein DA1 [Pseudomonadota bacterium]
MCGEILEGTYIKDPWGKSAHAFHNCHICNSCSRIISPKTSSGGHVYTDGRAICGYCDRTAIKGSIKASFSKRKVQSELEKIGFKDIPKNTKIHLVDQIALSNQSTYDLAKGLTRTEFQFKNNRRTGMVHMIYILHGLPRIEFEGIVAHELMHVWLNENDFKLSPMHTEGICNLASYWIYKRDKSELSGFLIKSLMENNDPTYGNGFRLMLKRAQKMGWKKLIAELSQNKQGFEESIWKKIFG